MSDSLVAVVNVPFQLVYQLHDEWTLGEPLCKISSYVQGVVLVSSILTLTGIAVDRYYAICRPLQARYLHTVRRAGCLVVVFWVSSLVLLLPQLYIQRLDPLLIVDVQRSSNSSASASLREVHVCVEYFVDWRWNVVYTLVLYVALCILPVLTMLVAYGRIAYTLWFHATPGDVTLTAFDAASGADKRLDERKRVVRMLFIIVSVFAVSWFPFFTLQVSSLFDSNDVSATSRRTLTACLHLVAYTNCAVNPLIYCLLNERFKATLNKLAATAKSWRLGGGVPDRRLTPTGTNRLSTVAGQPLRLGLLLTRDAGMSVDVARSRPTWPR